MKKLCQPLSMKGLFSSVPGIVHWSVTVGEEINTVYRRQQYLTDLECSCLTYPESSRNPPQKE